MSAIASNEILKAIDFNTDFAKAFLDPATQSQFIIDIARYNKAKKDLAQQFHHVQQRFDDFAGRGLLNDDSVQYAKTWGEIHVDFLAVLKDSRELAREIAKGCDHYFATVVQPAAEFTKIEEVEAESVRALLQHITQFISDCRELERVAISTRDRIAGVASAVKTLRDRFAQYDTGKLSANATRITEIGAAISELNSESGKVEARKEDVRNMVSGRDVGGKDRIVLDVLEVQAQAIEDKLNEFRQATHDIGVENEVIGRIKAELALVNTGDIHSIVGGTEYFRLLWAQITADVQSIHGYLDKITRRASKDTKPEDIPPSVLLFLKNGTTLYHTLREGLKLYVEGADEAEKVESAA